MVDREARPAPVSAGSRPLRVVLLVSARLVDLRAITLTPPQSYESDCRLVNDVTQRLSYEWAGGAQAAPLRGNSAT
jgi:hypothetical protein